VLLVGRVGFGGWRHRRSHSGRLLGGVCPTKPTQGTATPMSPPSTAVRTGCSPERSAGPEGVDRHIPLPVSRQAVHTRAVRQLTWMIVMLSSGHALRVRRGNGHRLHRA
jgi:hypothetical protein